MSDKSNLDKKVVLVLTNTSQLGDTGKPSGWYLPEAAHPYQLFKETNRCEVIFASPKGGEAPLDPSSLSDFKDDEVCTNLLKDRDFVEGYKNTKKVSDLEASDIDALYFVGGHGTMWDFPNSKSIQELTQKVYENKGVVAAVCHGPAALVDVRTNNGSYLIEGKTITGFSNEEEEDMGKTLKIDKFAEKVLPFKLEDRIGERKALYTSGEKWDFHVVVDSRVVTGQNPASASGVAREVIYLLGIEDQKSK